jgi:hypothetical protein
VAWPTDEHLLVIDRNELVTAGCLSSSFTLPTTTTLSHVRAATTIVASPNIPNPRNSSM